MRTAAAAFLLVAITATNARAVDPGEGNKKPKLSREACDAKVDALKAFLDAGAEQERHTALCEDCALAPLPLAKGKGPTHPAATVEVKRGGISVTGDGQGGAVRLPAGSDARVAAVLAAINATPTIAFLKGNPNAAARGILIGAAPDAPWELVVAAATAAGRTREQVWLLFRPEDSKVAPPPPSPLSSALGPKDKNQPRQEHIRGFFQAVTKEIAPCPPIRDVLAGVAGQFQNRRVKYMADKLPPVARACRCEPDPASLATLAYEQIQSAAVAVEVPLAAATSGKTADVAFAGDTRWEAAYPAVIEKLEQAKGEPLRLKLKR